MSRSGIYKITSPTGRVYIGKSIDIDKRWKTYRGLHCKSQPALFSSLSSHGVNEHSFEVVEECSVDDLSLLELKWYIHYSATHEMLNCVIPDVINDDHILKSDKDQIIKTEINKWCLELSTWSNLVFKIQDLLLKSDRRKIFQLLAKLVKLNYIEVYCADNYYLIRRNQKFFQFKLME